MSFFTSGVNAIFISHFLWRITVTVQEASRFDSREITFSLDSLKFTCVVWISEIERENSGYLAEERELTNRRSDTTVEPLNDESVGVKIPVMTTNPLFMGL